MKKVKVKAVIGFAGAVSMAAGEVRDVPEDVAAPLLKCGYLEAVDVAPAPENKESTPPDNPDNPDNEASQDSAGEKGKKGKSKKSKTED